MKKKRGDCHKKPVSKEFIEDFIVHETMKEIRDDKTIKAIVSMVMDLHERENTNLPLYEQQLKEAETGINNLLNAIQQGILTPSTKSRLEELEAAKEDLEIKIANEKLAKLIEGNLSEQIFWICQTDYLLSFSESLGNTGFPRL